ncbi:MAG: DUF2188 domain-containing protein [Peptostreptococcaceae bacterium]|nr:DUF2188 domain-containing protein [Peptostreptococcaceae bacterium]
MRSEENDSYRANIQTDTQQAAIMQGRALSQNQATVLIIHQKDGKILKSDRNVVILLH